MIGTPSVAARPFPGSAAPPALSVAPSGSAVTLGGEG